MSVPNQKTIIITRSSDKASRDYLKVSNENLYLAMVNLKYTTFILWIYFVDNSNNYKLELSTKDFNNKSGLSYSTYTRAFKELEDKGYLIKSEKNSNLYLFKEKSDKITTKKSDKIFNLEQEEVEDIKKKYFSQEDCQNN